MLLQACLGICVEGGGKHLFFDRPYLPEGVRDLWIRDLRIGDSRISLFLERAAGPVKIEILEKQGDVTVELR